MAGRKCISLAERFKEKYVVDEETGCHEWAARRMPSGYGQFSLGGSHQLAHRVSWELNYGLIPEGLHVLHRCDNPRCVNPEHLFLGTHQDNMDDMVAKGRRQKGESQWKAVLTEPQARAIIELCRRHPGRYPGQSGYGLLTFLSRYFGLTHGAVCEVAKGKNWRHLATLPAPGKPATELRR